MKEETTYHIPVLLMPSVDGMNIRPDGTYVDVTFGGDRTADGVAWAKVADCWGRSETEDAEQNIVNDPHFDVSRGNFRYLETSCVIMVSGKWTPYSPTSACRHIISTIASGDSLSALTVHSICG